MKVGVVMVGSFCRPPLMVIAQCHSNLICIQNELEEVKVDYEATTEKMKYSYSRHQSRYQTFAKKKKNTICKLLSVKYLLAATTRSKLIAVHMHTSCIENVNVFVGSHLLSKVRCVQLKTGI